MGKMLRVESKSEPETIDENVNGRESNAKGRGNAAAIKRDKGNALAVKRNKGNAAAIMRDKCEFDAKSNAVRWSLFHHCYTDSLGRGHESSSSSPTKTRAI